MSAIRVRGVRHAFDGDAVLDGIDLDVAAGEFVALVGPSGCGKSTLLSVLAGLLDPDAGTVEVEGGHRLGRLALMPQRDTLLPWCTVGDNVALGARLAGLAPAQARAAVREVLPRVGLGGYEEHYPHALSGGMRQRAALARTMLGRSGGWLLDEPLGALDALTRAEVRAVLADAWTEHRPTTVLVTHDLDEAVLLADRVLVCGPRPARIVADVPVTIPRPRTLDDTLTPPFAALRGRLLAELRGAGALA